MCNLSSCRYKPFSVPDPPLLLQARVQEGPPFNVTGVDFAGAMYVRNKGNLSKSNVYKYLFTCASTRAVHFDFAEKTLCRPSADLLHADLYLN